jgi:hypothetical protein
VENIKAKNPHENIKNILEYNINYIVHQKNINQENQEKIKEHVKTSKNK